MLWLKRENVRGKTDKAQDSLIVKEGNQNKKQNEKQTEKRKTNKSNEKQGKKGMEAEIKKSNRNFIFPILPFKLPARACLLNVCG